MIKLKFKLINYAIELHGTIYPCNNLHSIDESFTIENNTLIFWFNDIDDSTHILKINIPLE